MFRNLLRVVGVAALVLGLAGTGWADTYTVTLDGDAGWDQLLGYLNTAAGTAGDHTININGGLTLTRTSGTGITKELTWATTTADSLTIVGGVGGGVTTLNAQAGAGDESRVLYLKSSATVQNLTITGGYVNELPKVGAGVRVEAQSRLSNLVVTGNTAANTTLGGGGGIGVLLNGHNSIIEYCTVTQNTSMGGYYGAGGSTYYGGGGIGVFASNVFIANSVIADNVARMAGGGLYKDDVGTGANFHVFGSLFYGNSVTESTLGSAMHLRQADTTEATFDRVLNTTLADNAGGDYGFYVVSPSNTERYVLRNSVLSQNGLGLWNSGGVVQPVLFQYTVVDDSLTGAYIYYGNNPTGNPLFVDRSNDDYRLTAASNAVDIGAGYGSHPYGYLYMAEMTDADKVLAFGGSSGDYDAYTMYYVPFIAQTTPVYDKGTDIIVHLDGFVPAPADYLGNHIYTTDLAGNPRVYGGLIDAGAYEWQPEPVQDPIAPIAEPAGLGLLGLALLGLRKRRS